MDATSTLNTASGDVFTSMKDDANGGDTDPAADPDATMPMPAAGDWVGITENGVCRTASNILYSTPGC